MNEVIVSRLRQELAGCAAWLESAVTDVVLRARIESMVAGLHYVAGDRQSAYYLAPEQFAAVLIQTESEQAGKLDQLLHFYNDAFNHVTQRVIGELTASEGDHGIFIRKILADAEAGQAFEACSRSFLLASAMKRISCHPDGTALVNELIETYRAELLRACFLLRFQYDWIKQAVSGKRATVGFYCPDRAFRKNFGQLPRLLEEQGYAVLYLYGMVADDEFESHPTSFYVGGGLILKLDFVDLYFTGTILDVLPDGVKKALIIHGSFAPFEPEIHEEIVEERGEAYAPFVTQYRRAVAARTHFSAFFRLYDYYIVSSAHFRQAMQRFGAELGMPACDDANPSAKPAHRHFEVLNQALQGRRLPENTFIVPAGYPQIDVNTRVAAAYDGPLKTITYAPTPLNGKPAWNQYSSLYNSGKEIVGALLDAFPDYEIVFKPHIQDRNEQTMAVIDTYSGHPGFVVDWSGSSYMELYARTAVLVSDFSSTAYTFALSTLRPVLFSSPGEDLMPAALADEPYSQHRTDVGLIARTTDEAVAGVRTLLNDREQFENRIRQFRDQNIFHVGHTEEYLCESVANMISGEAPSEWDCLRNFGAGESQINDPAHCALHRDYPAIKSYLSAWVPEVAARDRVEHLVAWHYYLVGDAYVPEYYSAQHYVMILANLENDHAVRVDRLLETHNSTFDSIIESVVGELMQAQTAAGQLLQDVLQSNEATQMLVQCAKSFLLACTLKQSAAYLDSASVAEPLRKALLGEMTGVAILKRLHRDFLEQGAHA